MSWLSILVKMVTMLGPRVKQAWPYLEHIGHDLMEIVAIMNGGKMPTFAGAPTATEGTELVNALCSQGVPLEDARKLAVSAEALDGRM